MGVSQYLSKMALSLLNMNDQLIYSIPAYMGLNDVFLCLNWYYVFFDRNTTGVLFCPLEYIWGYRISINIITGDINFDLIVVVFFFFQASP